MSTFGQLTSIHPTITCGASEEDIELCRHVERRIGEEIKSVETDTMTA